jgi:hypothetical protein
MIDQQIAAYNGSIVDLFALGVVLFLMYKRDIPFTEARINDLNYRLIAQNRNE